MSLVALIITKQGEERKNTENLLILMDGAVALPRTGPTLPRQVQVILEPIGVFSEALFPGHLNVVDEGCQELGRRSAGYLPATSIREESRSWSYPSRRSGQAVDDLNQK